jgi:hypothetical protein
MGSGKLVYGEEVTSIRREGGQGPSSSKGVLAMVRKNEERTVRDCSLASRRPAVATGFFSPLDKLPRYPT